MILVETDLADPAAVAAVTAFADDVAALDTDLLARGEDGRVAVDRSALAVLEGSSRLSEVEAARVVAAPGDDGEQAARLSVGLVGSRAQENVEAARGVLEPMVDELSAELAALHPGSRATLTDRAPASLDAVSRSLQVSAVPGVTE